MAYEANLETLAGSTLAGADLSASQYRAVKGNGSGNYILASVAGERVVGVVQNKPTSGKAATIAVRGITKMVAGAALALNAEVMTDNQGRAVLATAGLQILGRAVIAAGAAGEIISVALDSRGIV